MKNPLIFNILTQLLLVTSFISTASAANVEYPEGHTNAEKEQLWHLSEGADVFPLRWFLNIESIFQEKGSKNLDAKIGRSMLYHRLDRKHGIIETNTINSYEYEYETSPVSPMKWVGMTLAWSEPSDNLVEPNDITIAAKDKPHTDFKAAQVLKKIDALGVVNVAEDSPFGGKIKIPMVGTNCAFCHSGMVRFNSNEGPKDVFIEGAPNMLNVRGFFADMIQSTLATMLDEKRLEKYLNHLSNKDLISMKEEEIPGRATQFTTNFKKDLLGMPQIGDGKFSWLRFKNTFRGLLDRRKMLKSILGNKENHKTLQKYMTQFLAMSYDIPEDQIKSTPVLDKRMEWIVKIVGIDPKLPLTKEGYGRTDAFGRISNAVARGPHPVPLIAPVSFPPMWGMKYSNLFHYNGNTNSVIMRNLGQPLGLGALVLDDQYTATTNVSNINKMEQLIYKIPFPEWNAMAPKELKVSKDNPDIVTGCNVYVQKCMGCHRSGKRVGPNGHLIKHYVHNFKKIGTDSNYAMLQSTPLVVGDGEVPFRQGLFTLTKSIKDRYKVLMSKKNPDFATPEKADETMARWENRTIRGKEHFRDTYLGEQFDFEKDPWLLSTFNFRSSDVEELKYMKIPAGKYGYIAKDLAGVWASAPYLHNASVPTIWDLISPLNERNRPKKFYVGCRTYDHEKLGYVYTPSDFAQAGCRLDERNLFDVNEKLSSTAVINGKKDYRFGNGNSNAGHSGPDNVVEDINQRKALITFLKVLRPEAEYSWHSEPMYQFVKDETGNIIGCQK